MLPPHAIDASTCLFAAGRASTSVYAAQCTAKGPTGTHAVASFAAWASEQQAQMAQQQHQAQMAQQAAQAQQGQPPHVPSDDEGDTPMSLFQDLTGDLFQNSTAESQAEPDDAALQAALAQAMPPSGANLELSPTQPFGPALSAFPVRRERVCPYSEPQGKPSS